MFTLIVILFVRYLLGDERNTDLLLSFINAVNEDHDFPLLKSVIIKNPINLKNLVDEKESVIDVKANDESGRQYDIEVQIDGTIQYLNRSLYYWARLYHSQIDEGEDYKKLKPTICINLINFKLFKGYKEVHSCFVLKEKRHPELELTDHLLIHYIELYKFVKESEFMLSFDKWMAFFRFEGERDDIMEEIIKNDPILSKAHERYKQFTQNERFMDIYHARMKQQADEKTRLIDAEEKGLQQGSLSEDKKILIRQMDKKYGLTEEEKQLILAQDNKSVFELALDKVLFAESKAEVLTVFIKPKG